jgi:hypothetical protein
MTLRNLGRTAGISVVVVCVLLYAYYPAVPHSMLGWVALLALGAPVWISLEWFGEAVGESRFFKRRSSGMRILFGVPVVLALMVIAWLGTRLVQWAVLAAG